MHRMQTWPATSGRRPILERLLDDDPVDVEPSLAIERITVALYPALKVIAVAESFAIGDRTLARGRAPIRQGLVLSCAAYASEIETNVREALIPIPTEVWNQALNRIDELDAQEPDASS